MLVGSVLLFGFITHAAGGVGVVTEVTQLPGGARLFELDAAIPFPVLLGIGLAGSLKLLIDPRQVSRFYGLRDERSLRTGIWVAVLGIPVISSACFRWASTRDSCWTA